MHEDEADIVARARKGDASAFSVLHQRHAALVQRLSLLYVGRQDAPDAAQEIWLTVFRKLGDLGADASFVPWLRTLTYYKCLDFRRTSTRRKGGELALDADAWRILAECVADDGDGLEDALERQEVRCHVLDAIDQLPEQIRALIRMRLLGGFAYGHIAATVHLPLATVKWRLHEARRLLRIRLATLLAESRGAAR